MKSLMTRIYSSMTEDGLYGSNLASGLNTNTDVEMSSFKNSTVNSAGSDIGCFDSRPTWGTLNSTWNNLYYVINYANDFLQSVEESPLWSEEVSKTDLPKRSKMYGEVKTLRAMFYLDLIRTWEMWCLLQRLRGLPMISLAAVQPIVIRYWNFLSMTLLPQSR